MKVRVKNPKQQEQDLSQSLIPGHVYGLITDEDEGGYNKHGGIAALYCDDEGMVDLRTGKVLISYDEGVRYMDELIDREIEEGTITEVVEFKFGELKLIRK